MADPVSAQYQRPSLHDEIASVLNRHSCENVSDTPDFILAQYLLGCLEAFDRAVIAREDWYGVKRGLPASPEPAPETPAEKAPPFYTPARPAIGESDPDKWPEFPGQNLNYRGEEDDAVHTGGPR